MNMPSTCTSERLRLTSFISVTLFVLLATRSTPIGGSAVNKACSYDQADIASCAGPILVKFASPSPDLQLQHYCSEMALASRCMDTKVCAGNTADASTAIWYGLKDGMNFACTREQEYLQHDVCMSSNATMNALKLCNPSKPSTPQTELEGCILVNKVFKCMWTTITAKCGEETARFVQEFMKRISQPTLNNIHCVVEDMEGKQSSVASSLHQISVLWSALILPFLSLVLTGCYKLN